MRLTTAATLLVALAPASTFAVDYMTTLQASQQLFPEATRFETRTWIADQNALQQLNAQGIRLRSTQWNLQLAWRGAELLGVMASDEVLGKFELIRYAVGVGVDGRIRGVEILSYRESHGSEIRLPAWRKQFIGKSQTSPISVGADITNISGATLSCTHVTEGVKRLVLMIDLARRSGGLGTL